MAKTRVRYQVNYTSSRSRSAGDETFTTKQAAILGFIRIFGKVASEPDPVVTLTRYSQSSNLIRSDLLAMKDVGETCIRFRREYWA